MRRLTLILSDLYLPSGALQESFPATLELPALSWLLRFAGGTTRIDDWRAWLARDLGADGIADQPLAHVCAQGQAPDVSNCWLAAPVALEARLDHVRLRDRGLLRLSPDERQALCVEFSASFGGQIELRENGERSLLLTGGPSADVRTLDPARLLDADIGQALPAGSPAARELRRLGTEIEMWLHASRVNAAREKAGKHRIAALWLWGGGAARPGLPDRQAREPAARLHGGDELFAALHAWLGQPPSARPQHLAELSAGAPACVEFAPMSGNPRESLTELERHWFAPARAALSSGQLDALRLIANDRVFQVDARAGWKFWRRQRGWLEYLVH